MIGAGSALLRYPSGVDASPSGESSKPPVRGQTRASWTKSERIPLSLCFFILLSTPLFYALAPRRGTRIERLALLSLTVKVFAEWTLRKRKEKSRKHVFCCRPKVPRDGRQQFNIESILAQRQGARIILSLAKFEKRLASEYGSVWSDTSWLVPALNILLLAAK